jgi:hypothetical protein
MTISAEDFNLSEIAQLVEESGILDLEDKLKSKTTIHAEKSSTPPPTSNTEVSIKKVKVKPAKVEKKPAPKKVEKKPAKVEKKPAPKKEKTVVSYPLSSDQVVTNSTLDIKGDYNKVVHTLQNEMVNNDVYPKNVLTQILFQKFGLPIKIQQLGWASDRPLRPAIIIKLDHDGSPLKHGRYRNPFFQKTTESTFNKETK